MKLKKIIVFFSIFTIILWIIFDNIRFNNNNGNVNDVNVVIDNLTYFSNNEIMNAVSIITARFKQIPATLYEIKYDDKKSSANAIYFHILFHTYSKTYVKRFGLNPNEKYEWICILNKTNNN